MALSSQKFADAIRKHYPALVVPTKVPKSFWARLGKAIKDAGYTAEDAERLGFWLSNQKWIKEPMSVLTVANKGGEWLAKISASKQRVSAKHSREAEDEQWIDLEGLQ